MFFGSAHQLSKCADCRVMLRGMELEVVNVYKYLGVKLDGDKNDEYNDVDTMMLKYHICYTECIFLWVDII